MKSKALKAMLKEEFGSSDVNCVVAFANEHNVSYRYKLKEDGLYAKMNKERLGKVSRFELDEETLVLYDGYHKITPPRAIAQREILPRLARLARVAGVSGLERYCAGSNRSQPGRQWEVVTSRGVYIRDTFSARGNPLRSLKCGSRVSEIEAILLSNELWVKHESGWSLAARQLPNGTFRDLMVEREKPRRESSSTARRGSSSTARRGSSSTARRGSSSTVNSKQAVSDDHKRKSDIHPSFAARRKSTSGDPNEKKISTRELHRLTTDSASSLPMSQDEEYDNYDLFYQLALRRKSESLNF